MDSSQKRAGRINYHNYVINELRCENPKTGQRAELQHNKGVLFVNPSSKTFKFLQESSFKAPSHDEEVIQNMEEATRTLRMTSEEEGKELKVQISKAPWTLHKAPDGRIYYHNSETKESRWENPETVQGAKAQGKSEKLYVNLSEASEFLQESSFEEKFGKFSFRVSEKLTKDNCVKLATYFNFPPARIDQIRNGSKTPGITLLDILKERHIVNIHNVMSLKEALEELQLKDIIDTLVTPYQREIDRLRFQQQYLS